MDTPHSDTGTPQTLSGEDITRAPHSGTGTPRSLSVENIMRTPHSGTGRPHADTGTPQTLSGENTTGTPHSGTGRPHADTGTPQTLSGEDITRAPHAETGTPHVASDPVQTLSGEDITRAPHAETGTHSGTGTPHAETGAPHSGTGTPHVASDPLQGLSWENTPRAPHPETGTPHVASNSVQSLSMGAVLSRTLSTMMQNPVLFFGLAIVACAPGVVLGLMDVKNPAVLKLVDMIMNLSVQGAMAYGVFHALQGRSVAFGASVSCGLTNLMPLIGIALLSGVCTFLGVLVFVIPGIILMCMWMVSAPACVVEQLGVIDSMKRSAQLTHGSRMKIFGLIVLTFLVPVVLMAAFNSALATAQNPLAVAAFFLALLVVVLAYSGVMASVLYVDLRELKEGTTLDSLVSVFD